MARPPKDAIVLCLDVGPGMSQAPPGCDSPLDASIKIISMMVQRKIFSGSKDEIGLVLFGTEKTFNALHDGEEYQNITVQHGLCIPGFELLESVKNIEPGPEETDFLDAITVGLDVLHEQTKGKKIEYRRLVLFTNFDQQFSDDNLDGIVRGFCCENEEVQLNVISPEFEEPLPSNEDEHDSGSDGEGPSTKKGRQDNNEMLSKKPKTPQQRAGEKVISQILSQGVEGCVYSYDQAIIALTGFEKKSVRSVAWKCELTLGGELTIPCVAFVKAKASALKKTWAKCYAKTGKAEDIENQKYYVLQDDPSQEVDGEDISNGYKYGKDVVPFTENDVEQMKYKTEGKCLSILAFTDLHNILTQDLMDDQAHFVFAEKDDEAAASAIAALVTALHNQNMCAVARYVYRKGSNPKLVALMPRIRKSYRCLVMVALPFAEDMRMLDFPSLESKRSDSPSVDQLSAIDSLIDGMDLSQGTTEFFHPSGMMNPYFQCVYHNLSHRACNPRDDMPPLDKRIEDILAPKEEIIHRSRFATEQVKKCFVLEKQEDKKKKKAVEWAEFNPEIKPDLAAGDASNDLSSASGIFNSSSEVRSVGSITPDQDFITLLKNASGEERVRAVFEQLQQKLFEFVMNSSFNPSGDKKLLPCLQIMKQQAIEKKQAVLFNSFLRELKSMVIGRQNTMHFWEEMVSSNLSLIGDGVTSSEVENFLAGNVKTSQEDVKIEENDDDVEDLLDEL